MAITAPVPRPPHRFWRCGDRWMTISRHPGSSAGPLPSLAVSPTRNETFRSMCLPTVSSADPRSELGPRSLDPDRPFWGAYAELIRDQSSPTDFCNCITTCGQPNPGSSRSSQGRRPRSPSFSRHATHSPLRASLNGDTRRAAQRPVTETPVKVPLAYASFPNRDASAAAPPPKACARGA